MVSFPDIMKVSALQRSRIKEINAIPLKWSVSTVMFFVFAVGLFAFGWYLRFHQLTLAGLWTDELFSVSAALDVGGSSSWLNFTPKLLNELDISDSFLTWKAADNTPPLFELLLIVWCKLFGNSDFAVRSLNATLGSAAPVIFFFGLRRRLGDFAAILGSAIFVFSPSAIAYAQEARAYTLALFLCTIALVRIVNRVLDESTGGSQNESWSRSVWIDVVLLVLLAYSHYTGLFVAGLLFLIYFFFIVVPQKRYPDVFKFVLVPLAIAPWMWLSERAIAFTNAGGMAWRDYHLSQIASLMIPRTLNFFLVGGGSLFAAIWLVALMASLTMMAKNGSWIVSMDGLGLRCSHRRNLLAIFLASSVVLLFFYTVYNAFHAKMWHPRYFTVAIPIVVTSLAVLFSSQKIGKLLPLFLTSLIIAVSVESLVSYYKIGNHHKEEYREASSYISQIVRNDAIIMLGWTRPNAAYYIHYLNIFLNPSARRYELVAVSTFDDVEQICHGNPLGGRQIVLFQHVDQAPYFAEMRRCPNIKLVSARRFRGLVVDEYVGH
jgi:uncharacterized membrane protein